VGRYDRSPIDLNGGFERRLKYLLHFEEFVFIYPNARFNNRGLGTINDLHILLYDEDNMYII